MRVRSFSVLIGGAVLAMVVVAALSANAIFDADPLDMVARPFIWPGADAHHPLGTDMLGRDMLVGVIYAARMSLEVGLASAGLAVLLGIVLGLPAGYFGGATDEMVMQLSELCQTMPPLLFAIVVVVVLQPSATSIVLGIAVTGWPQVARLIRAEAIRLRHAEFVEAARVMGMGPIRILVTHLLPNAISPVIVSGSVLVATAILTEAALSFLGLGDPNRISWGSMIGAGRDALRTAWYMTAIPGVALSVTVLALSMLGNGLGDILNPRAPT